MAVMKLGRSQYSENAAQRRRDKAADLHDDAVESDSASTVSSSLSSTASDESESLAMVPPKVRFMEPKSKSRAGPVLSLRGAEKKERGRCAMSADNRRKQTSSLKKSLKSKDKLKERGKQIQNHKTSSPREEGERSKDKARGPSRSADRRRKQNPKTSTARKGERSKDHRRKQQKMSSPREGERSQHHSGRDRPPSNGTPTTAPPVADENRCDVCHQTVRGGESGMEQHRLWSVRHRTYQLHKNGDNWEDAKKKAQRQLRCQSDSGSVQALSAESVAAIDAKPTLANRNDCLADFLVCQANLIRSMSQ